MTKKVFLIYFFSALLCPLLSVRAQVTNGIAKLKTAVMTAKTQLLYTDYQGKDKLQKGLSEAETVLNTKNVSEKKAFRAASQLTKSTNIYLSNRPSEWVTIRNGQIWKTVEGDTIQAHAPGFVRVGDVWYMVGEDRASSWHPDVNLYSSVDLVHWHFVRKIIENGVTDKRLGRNRMIERAKLMYNEKTAKFVIWCHWEALNYGASEAACFVSDTVDGTYQLAWSGRPLGIKSRDCNIFIDNDGKAYFISTTNENQDLGMFGLSADYKKAESHTVLFQGERREAPAIVRVGDRYFMFSSACSGWAPNQCKLSYSNSLTDGWSPLTNIGDHRAFDTQAAAILEVKGTKQTTYLYVGDRWMDPDLPSSKTIIFPITFKGTTCHFAYRDSFEINFVTGECR